MPNPAGSSACSSPRTRSRIDSALGAQTRNSVRPVRSGNAPSRRWKGYSSISVLILAQFGSGQCADPLGQEIDEPGGVDVHRDVRVRRAARAAELIHDGAAAAGTLRDVDLHRQVLGADDVG